MEFEQRKISLIHNLAKELLKADVLELLEYKQKIKFEQNYKERENMITYEIARSFDVEKNN